MKRNILLNPGPVTTSSKVKKSQVVPDICPREKEFGNLTFTICNDLSLFAGSKKNLRTVLFSGSGTSAIESILTSVLPKNKKILIINNGSYGKRMVEIAKRYHISHKEFKSSSLDEIDYNSLENTIKKTKNIAYIAMVHHETTTGLLNNINKINKILIKYKLYLLLDAMSSFGAIPINMKKNRIAFLGASSNKAIEGMPGVSFVICDKNFLSKISKIKSKSYYLDLYQQYLFFKKNHQFRFTPPVQTMYAFKAAIDLLKKEGIKNRYKRYKKMWGLLTKGLRLINQKYLVDKKNHSKLITTIELDNKINFDEMHDFFYKKQVTIYPTKITKPNSFRVANIGQINLNDIQYFLKLFKIFLKKKHVIK